MNRVMSITPTNYFVNSFLCIPTIASGVGAHITSPYLRPKNSSPNPTWILSLYFSLQKYLKDPTFKSRYLNLRFSALLNLIISLQHYFLYLLQTNPSFLAGQYLLGPPNMPIPIFFSLLRLPGSCLPLRLGIWHLRFKSQQILIPL